jgi:hypothetical protein
MWSSDRVSGDGKVVSADVQEVLARAEGIAAGQGDNMVLAEHVLLSLLWTRSSLFALALIERIGSTRQQILAELRHREVSLEAPMPTLPAWGQWARVERRDFERVAATLRREGTLYRYSEQGDTVLISTDRRTRRPRSPCHGQKPTGSGDSPRA